MPLIKWKCSVCGSKKRALIPAGEMYAYPDCDNKDCRRYRHPMERDTGGSTSVMETRDNGAMPRSVERHRDIEELRKSHADLQKPKDDGIV